MKEKIHLIPNIGLKGYEKRVSELFFPLNQVLFSVFSDFCGTFIFNDAFI